MDQDLVYQIARAFWTSYGSPAAYRPAKTDTVNILWRKSLLILNSTTA